MRGLKPEENRLSVSVKVSSLGTAEGPAEGVRSRRRRGSTLTKASLNH